MACLATKGWLVALFQKDVKDWLRVATLYLGRENSQSFGGVVMGVPSLTSLIVSWDTLSYVEAGWAILWFGNVCARI